MALYVGIMCAKCERVFVVTKTSRIKRYDSIQDESRYKLTCVSPCRAITDFTRADLRAYSVAATCVLHGFVLKGEYQELAKHVRG